MAASSCLVSTRSFRLASPAKLGEPAGALGVLAAAMLLKLHWGLVRTVAVSARRASP